MSPEDVDENKDDDYPTGEFTTATLRVHHQSANPELVTAALGLEPDESSAAVTDDRGRKRPMVWLLSSEGRVESRDVRQHVDWLTSQLEGRAEAIAGLRQEAFAVDVFCRWDGIGQGGPMLSPHQVSSLAALRLTIRFDTYS